MNKYNSTTKIISNSHSITFHLNFSKFIFVSLLLLHRVHQQTMVLLGTSVSQST